MQDRIWTNLANIKFKCIYTGKVSKRSYHVGNMYSIFLALTSAASVATWAIWDRFPFVWASIIAFSQVLHIVKPHILFIKNDREFIEQSLLYGALYLSYEKLWYDNRKEEADENQIEARFYNLRKKEHVINTRFKQVVCPIFKRLIKSSDEETNRYLETNF
jgi:hypothetical protein